MRGVAAVLERCCALFALSNVVAGSALTGGWTGIVGEEEEMQRCNEAVAELLRELRPDAVALVDAFDFPDRVLNSALGRRDGNVYEALFASARRSELNRAQRRRARKGGGTAESRFGVRQASAAVPRPGGASSAEPADVVAVSAWGWGGGGGWGVGWGGYTGPRE